MYDSIRRLVPEYFRKGRDQAILDRTEQFLETKHFKKPSFDETWHKSNRVALSNMRALKLSGEFQDVISQRTSIQAGKLTVLSTVDFFGTFSPTAANGKPRLVGVIVNPSGIKKASDEKRKLWMQIESEVAIRAAHASKIEIAEIMYVDLPKQIVYRHVGPKKRVWDEIDATCERILRDWHAIRLEMSSQQEGTA
jgi:hypothetical protein